MSKIGVCIFISFILLAGCSTKTESIPKETSMQHMHESSTSMPIQKPSTTPQSSILEVVPPESMKPDMSKKYTLDAKLTKEGSDYYVTIQTNLKLDGLYGGTHVYGEGHIHLYINDSLIGPIKDTKPYPISKFLLEGTNKVDLVLAGNDHSMPYNQSKGFSIKL